MTIPNPIIPEAPMANAIDDVKAVEIPMGAIENGRAYIDRLEHNYGFACEAGTLGNCSDWHELVRCFEYMANCFNASPAPSQHTGWGDEAVERLAYRLQSIMSEHLAVEDGEIMGTGKASFEMARAASSIAPVTGRETRPKLSELLEGEGRQTEAWPSIAPATGFEVKDLAAEFEHGVTQQTQDYNFNQGPGGDWLFQCSEWINISAIFRSISPLAYPNTGFKVNKLEWRDLWGVSRAKTCVGVYQIKSRPLDGAADLSLANGAFVLNNWVSTFEKGKATAQADFDRRIRSSISPSVAKESGEP